MATVDSVTSLHPMCRHSDAEQHRNRQRQYGASCENSVNDDDDGETF